VPLHRNQAGAFEFGPDPRRWMHEGSERRAAEASNTVLEPGRQPNPPFPARIDRAVEAARLGRRKPDQRLHLGIAADHPIEGDQVGNLDSLGEGDEVPAYEPDSVTMAPAGGLFRRDLEKGGGNIEVDGLLDVGTQQLVMNRADSTPDVEEGGGRDR